MEREETLKEKVIRDYSERKNPYAKECPGRHLWSEGFRSGYNYASEVAAEDKEIKPKT